jgi:hypothetical protein
MGGFHSYSFGSADRHGKKLLRAQNGEMTNPGRRPSMWWRYDAPLFERQAEYLKRHGLLLASEERRVGGL